MKKTIWSILPLIVIFSSCNVKITTSLIKSYPKLEDNSTVNILDINEKEPNNAEVLGKVKIGDPGFTFKCGYDIVIEKAKIEARKIGGNALHITEHKIPSIFGSNCHRIKADILKLDRVNDTLNTDNNYVDTIDAKIRNKDYKHYKIVINGGYSYRLANVSSDVPNEYKSYVKGLKSGYHLGGDFAYYFNPSMGVGLKLNMFRASNEMNNVTLQSQYGAYFTGRLKDDITIVFIGPGFYTRMKGKRNEFNVNLSFGYEGYTNNSLVVYEPIKITGNTLGMALDFSYDIKISNEISIGLQTSYITGILTTIKRTSGQKTETIKLEKENYEGLNRLDFSVGIRIQK